MKRLAERYVPSPRARQAKAFSGQGNRLGSPAPTPTSLPATPEPASIPGSFPTASGSGASPSGGGGAQRGTQEFGTRFEVDQTKPTTSVQIRLADGTRMVARMNLTHTVGDIRNFINACVFLSPFLCFFFLSFFDLCPRPRLRLVCVVLCSVC